MEGTCRDQYGATYSKWQRLLLIPQGAAKEERGEDDGEEGEEEDGTVSSSEERETFPDHFSPPIHQRCPLFAMIK